MVGCYCPDMTGSGMEVYFQAGIQLGKTLLFPEHFVPGAYMNKFCTKHYISISDRCVTVGQE